MRININRILEMLERKTGKRHFDKDLAKLINVSSTTIYNWRSGKSNPGLKDIINICKEINEFNILCFLDKKS